MSKIDQKYINALSQFTDALDQIVDILTGQQKNKKSDVVNDFLKTPMDNLVTVVEDLKKVTKKGFEDVKSDNQKILAKIESIRQQRESGMFDRIEDPNNKNKIVDGIKVVILIAAGVLALGMAFKLIGKVDFLSVIALSTSMLLMSKVFSEIAAIKNLNMTNILLVSSVLPVISLGLLLSGLILKNFPTIKFGQALSLMFLGASLGVASTVLLKSIKDVDFRKDIAKIMTLPWVLPIISTALLFSALIIKNFPTITFGQGLSLIVIGGVIGVAAWILLKSLKDVNLTRDWLKIVSLPFILPLISLGLLLSANILKSFPTFNFYQGLSIILIGGAVGVAAWILLKAIKGIDIRRDWLKIVTLPFTIPLIATAILLSALIFQGLPTNMKYPDIKWTLGVGLAFLVFVPVIYVIGKMKLKDVMLGLIAVPFIAYAIVSVANIFNKFPDNAKYPSFIWSLGVGLTVVIFGLLALGVGFVASRFKKEFYSGLIGIVAIAAAVSATDYFINKGEYNKYPSTNWLLGVGLSIVGFGIVAGILGTIFTLTGGVGAIALAAGLLGIIGIAGTILAVDAILQSGNFTKYPSVDWIKGAGLSILAFGTMSLAVGALIVGTLGVAALAGGAGVLAVIGIAKAMLEVDEIFNKGKFIKYPSEQWAKGVISAISIFANLDEKRGFLKSIGTALTGALQGAGGAAKTAAMLAIAKNMVEIDKVFSQGTFTIIPSETYSKNLKSYLLSLDQVTSNWNISISDAERFNKSIKLIFDSFSNVPTLNNNIVNNMSIIKKSIIELVEGVDAFMYEERTSAVGKIAGALFTGKKKRSMEDFMLFSSGLITIISAIQILSTLKPIPNGISKSFSDFLTQLKVLPEIPQLDTKAASINKLAMSFITLAESLGKVNSNLRDFGTLSRNLPLINTDKNLSKNVDNYKEELKIVNDTQTGQANLLTKINDFFSTPINVQVNKEESKEKDKISETEQQKRFYQDISDIRSLLYEFKDFIDRPSQTGSFYK